jgi:hypothetical protein
MFLLDGKPLSPDVAFTHDGIQYPANWLRLSTPEEREAIGITEVPDPASWDQRFYWGYDAEGHLIPKDHAQLVEQWVAQTRNTANTLLIPTDWIIIREADNGKEADPLIKIWRQDVRFATGDKVTAIEATTTTEELATYITGPEYPVWPSQDPAPVADVPEEPLNFSGSSTSASIL